MGRWLRKTWAFGGEGGFGNRGSGSKVVDVLGSRVVMEQVWGEEERRGVCERCEGGYGTF